MNNVTAAGIIGVTFILVGVIGFFPNPIIADSPDAIFHADAIHSSVHILSGIFFLVFVIGVREYLSVFMKVFGIVYFGLGVMGLILAGSSGMTRLLGFLHVNGADNYLHLALGVLIFVASTFRPSTTS